MFTHDGALLSAGPGWSMSPSACRRSEYRDLSGPSLGVRQVDAAEIFFRFGYDTNSGRVFVDGPDVRSVTQASLLEPIGLVPPELCCSPRP